MSVEFRCDLCGRQVTWSERADSFLPNPNAVYPMRIPSTGSYGKTNLFKREVCWTCLSQIQERVDDLKREAARKAATEGTSQK